MKYETLDVRPYARVDRPSPQGQERIVEHQSRNRQAEPVIVASEGILFLSLDKPKQPTRHERTCVHYTLTGGECKFPTIAKYLGLRLCELFKCFTNARQTFISENIYAIFH